MYGKSYESKYTGSMIGAGFNVFAVWDYVTTNARSGVIELNPRLLAFTLAGTREGAQQEVVDAIEYLCRPDPVSRSKEEDGRRMIREGEYQYRVVNWAKYQRIKNESDRREYNRIKQAEYRAKNEASLDEMTPKQAMRALKARMKIEEENKICEDVRAKHNPDYAPGGSKFGQPEPEKESGLTVRESLNQDAKNDPITLADKAAFEKL